jgi:hypothetical protein
MFLCCDYRRSAVYISSSTNRRQMRNGIRVFVYLKEASDKYLRCFTDSYRITSMFLELNLYTKTIFHCNLYWWNALLLSFRFHACFVYFNASFFKWTQPNYSVYVFFLFAYGFLVDIIDYWLFFSYTTNRSISLAIGYWKQGRQAYSTKILWIRKSYIFQQ